MTSKTVSGVVLEASDSPFPTPTLGLSGGSPSVGCLSAAFLSIPTGLKESLSTQPGAEDTIRQKAEMSTPSPVPVVEARSPAEPGGSLHTSGGRPEGAEPGQAQVQVLHLPVLQLPEPLLHPAEAYLWLPVQEGHRPHPQVL